MKKFPKNKKCAVCKKEYSCFRTKEYKTRKYCSKECKNESQRGKCTESQLVGLRSMWGKWSGRKHTEEAKKKMSESQKGKFGKEARGFKGGRRMGNNGYVYVLTNEKRIDRTTGNTKNKYAPEHRVVMEKELGRKLRRWEVVHHRNGIKHDNRIKNLELLTLKTHMGRVECPHCLKEFLIK